MPVVILTARSTVSDTVAGLDGGADDYITKPFSFEELLARVRVRLRGERTAEPTVPHLRELDARPEDAPGDRRPAGRQPERARVRPAEVFFRHPGQVLSREQLLSHVWGYDFDPGSNIVDVYVGYLRRKLGKHRISSIRGMGYRLEGGEREREGAVDER